MTWRQATLLCLLIAFALPRAGSLAAQTADEDELALAYGDRATVSIASGSRQALRRAPAVATVITADDIAAMGATDLDEVLETVPGIHVGHSANNYAPLYVIRGIYSNANPQTLMLQNGVPMTTLATGNRGNMWAGLPLENIARIEVIRGPGSALYGADAFAGVVNIITRAAPDVGGTQIGARAGSFNSSDGWVQHGGRLGPVEVAAYLRVGRTDGVRETLSADAQTRNDTLFGTQVSLAPGPVNTGRDAVDASLDLGYGKWRFRTGYKLRDNIGTGAGIASALDPVGKSRSERIVADLSWNDARVSDDWGLGFMLSHLQYEQTIPSSYQLLAAGATLPTGTFSEGMIGAPEFWERQLRLSTYATYSGFANHSLRFGIGRDDLDLYRTRELRNFTYSSAGMPIPSGSVMDVSSSGPFLRPHRRVVSYLLAQDEWKFAPDWALTAGLRHDHSVDFGNTTNPRLALVWDASLDLTAKLLYGQAFRAPAFAEQYSTTNPLSAGNPELRPETIRTLEAVFSLQARKDTQLNLSFFRHEMKDIIRAVANPTPGTGSTYQNTGGQHGEGMEFEAVWQADRVLRLIGHYAYQRSIDESTHADAGYAPHHHLYGRADWQASNGWLASCQVNRVADRNRPAGDKRPAVPDYTTVDLTVRTRRGKDHWDFAASVRNLFDAVVIEPSLAPGLSIPQDLPMAGRAFYLQASYAL